MVVYSITGILASEKLKKFSEIVALTGSGGENINEICHRSGARVKVEGLATDRNTERIITIRGTKDQIKKAKELIENYVSV